MSRFGDRTITDQLFMCQPLNTNAWFLVASEDQVGADMVLCLVYER